jgi:hypothetical protein
MPIRATIDTTDNPAPQRLDPGAEKPEGQALFETANLRPERTGLPFVVFVSQKGGARHDVRPSDMVTVAIRPSVRVVRGKLDPSDLAQLSRWTDLNQEVLIKYWDGVIEYTEDALAAPQPISADFP